MKDWINDLLLCTFLVIIGICVGYLLHFLTGPNLFDGLWIQGRSVDDAKMVLNDYDSRGDWVCVNIRGMDYQRALDVCAHEVGHDMYHEKFAELCEADFDKCNHIINEK